MTAERRLHSIPGGPRHRTDRPERSTLVLLSVNDLLCQLLRARKGLCGVRGYVSHLYVLSERRLAHTRQVNTNYTNTAVPLTVYPYAQSPTAQYLL